MLFYLVGILKILGIVLLALLGIILFILLLVLFVPIRYGADGSYVEKPDAEVRVSWLLKLIRVNVRYADGLEAGAKVLCFPVWSMKKDGEAEEEDAGHGGVTYVSAESEAPAAGQASGGGKPQGAETADNAGSAAAHPAEAQGSAAHPAAAQANAEASGPQETVTPADANPPGYPLSEVPAEEYASAEWESPGKEEFRKESEKRKKKKPKPKGPSLEEKLEGIMQKLDGLLKRKDRILKFLRHESTARLVRLLKRKLFRILKEILPRKYSGDLTLGFEDPATTGKALSAAAILYPVYRDNIRINPVFDRNEIRGDLHVSGRIHLIVFVVTAVQVWFNRDFKRAFRFVRKELKR